MQYKVNIEVMHEGDDFLTTEVEFVEALSEDAAIRAVEYIWSETVDIIGEAWVSDGALEPEE